MKQISLVILSSDFIHQWAKRMACESQISPRQKHAIRLLLSSQVPLFCSGIQPRSPQWEVNIAQYL